MTALRSSDVVRRGLRRTTSTFGAVLALLMLAVVSFGAAPASAAPSITPAQVQAQQWWIDRLALRQTWAVSKGAGVTVAVLDEGVDARFGDLRGAVVSGFVPGGSGTARTDTDPAMHGTRMADEVAGRATGFGLYGVAPAAKIMPVLIPHHGNVEPTVLALNRLAAMPHPPAVVNMSYGTTEACPPDLQAAVRRAVERGIILVGSAGNEAQLGNPTNTPANCPGVVAVGAVDVNGNPWSGSTRGPYVSLAAPGVHMIGYDPEIAAGYGYATGSSDAAAIVSGVFAVVRSHFPTMPARDVVTRVLYTARQLQGAAHTHNDATGYGIARPYHALKDRVPANAPNPVYDALAATPSSPAAGSSPGADSSTSPAGSVPSQAPHTVSQPGASSGGLGTGALVAIVAAVIVIVLIVIVVLLRRRGRPAHPAPPDNHFAPPRV